MTNDRCAALLSEERFSVQNAHGVIEGTLVVPAGCGPHPAALIIAGSGPTDRDGDSAAGVRARPYRLLADAFSAAGVATLRYDKAGIGASRGAAPPESEMRFEMGADDAALIVRALRADPRIGPITIIGHSEGSLVGILAAAREPVDALVSLAGAGRPIGAVLREQLAGIPDPALLAQANAIVDALEQGHTVSDVPPSLAALFRPSVQGYLISWMKYDPASELARLPLGHVFIVQGSTDIQVKVAEALRLKAARPEAQYLLVEGMNHVLKAADTTPASQQAAYTNPDLPLVPALAPALEAFVTSASTR